MEVYFDYSATTPVKPEVLTEMLPYYLEEYGNPSSIHSKGRSSKNAIEEARERIAKQLKCSASEIFFTSGGTESDNLAIKGVAQKKGKNGLYITSKIEHPAVLNTFEWLEKEGYNVVYIDVLDTGIINLKQLENIIKNNKVNLISIMSVNNEIGTIQPINEISKMAYDIDKEIIIHTDAVQLIGKMQINTDNLLVDMMSVSGHKFGAPKGVGFLYIADGIEINPQNLGGGQESGLRSGTENVAGIIGLAKAFEIANQKENNEIKCKEAYLLSKLSEIPNIHFNGVGYHNDSSLKADGIINMRIDGVEASSLINLLDYRGIYISAGSACHSNSDVPSHVLKAIGLSNEQALSSIRISFDNTISYIEIDYLVEGIKGCVECLRKF